MSSKLLSVSLIVDALLAGKLLGDEERLAQPFAH